MIGIRSAVVANEEGEARFLSLPLLVTLALAIAGLVSLLYLTQTSGVATTGYDLVGLQSERDRWRLRNEQIEQRIAETQALDRLEVEARTQLGMGTPREVIYVRAPRLQVPVLSQDRMYFDNSTASASGELVETVLLHVSQWLAQIWME